MKSKEVKIDGKYICRISGNLVTVQILYKSAIGTGWKAKNLSTGREVYIKSARRLQGVAK